MVQKSSRKDRTWVEEIEIAGSELVGRVRELIAEGNVRRLIIKKTNGDLLLEVPLTGGVLVGGVITIVTPVLAALGAMAALLARVRVEIVRVSGKDEKVNRRKP